VEFRPTVWRASGTRTSPRNRAALDSAWRSRDRQCSRTTARCRQTAASDLELKFDSCCR